jgi:hypothetical protein
VTARTRLVPLLLGLATALAVGPSASAGVEPTLYVAYNMQCTFTITGDNGAPVSVIPPGSYQVLVTSPVGFAEPDLSGVADPNYACGGAMSFRLTGPGVNLHTTMEGGDAAADHFQATFQVGGTYTAFEDRRPTVARVVFTVSSAAASTGGGSNTTGGGSNTGSTTSKPKTSTSTGSSGSLAVRGTLNGSVSTSGKLSLTLKGKKVASLKTGRYRITVLDETSKRGFELQKLGSKPVTVTKAGFLGRHSVTLTLRPGQWYFFSPSGKKTPFIVVG